MSVDHAFCCLRVLKSLVVPNSSASYIGLCMEWGSFGHEQLIRALQQLSNPATRRRTGVLGSQLSVARAPWSM